MIIASLTDGKRKPAVTNTVATVIDPHPVRSRIEHVPSPPEGFEFERPAVSLANGTWILKPHGNMGHGVLRIQNGGDLDAAVRLVSASVPRKLFWITYVRAHGEKTVNGIPVGSYLLRFALGRDWNTDSRHFLQYPWFYEAGKQLDFTETASTEERRGEYIELHVTLNEIIGGNLPRVGITEAVFNEGAPEN
jgi:hypothetical protein